MISSCDDRLYVKHICSGIIKEDPPTIPIIILPMKTVPIQLVVEPRAYNAYTANNIHDAPNKVISFEEKTKINGCAKACTIWA